MNKDTRDTEQKNVPIRVLHVLGTTERGGAESRIMDLYRTIDRSRVQFDFLVHADARPTGDRAASSEALMAVRKPGAYDEEIRALGGEIFALPRPSVRPGRTNFIAYRRACERFFSKYENRWRVVQGHMTSTAAVYLAEARRYGAPVTIAHARSAGVDPGFKGLVTKMLRRPLSTERRVRMRDGIYAAAVDYRFACSREAAASVFPGAPTVILPNAIDVAAFSWRQEARAEIRAKYGIENARVIGHVGSFRYAKNHEFLLHAFAELLKLPEAAEGRYCLLLVGDGSLAAEMKQLADRLGIREQVIFAGEQSRISDYYQAMDVFAFPSHYEGLPGTVVEAQAACLPCLISDRITADVDVTSLVRRASIGGNREEIQAAEQAWGRTLMEMIAARRPGAREELAERIAEKLKAAGFDVNAQARMLQQFYETGEGLPPAECRGGR